MKLLLTLGHHSSAILVDDDQVVCGFEEERLSKVKSTSAYPILAIEQILHFAPVARKEVDEILISHWFDLGPDNLSESKYFQPKHLKARFPFAKIKSVYPNFTHHDAHAGSVWNFSGFSTGLTIVADGFGNDGETVSIYRDGARIDRHYGMSLGLMYQYATSYLGMKENQDEYKLLGYESKVTKQAADKMETLINTTSAYVFSRIINSDEANKMSYVDLCSYNRDIYATIFNNLSDALSDQDDSLSSIAYAVQKILENVVIKLVEMHIEDNDTLQFSGGVFYNVKLNNLILNTFADNVDIIEFMPLAGDQGAAIGFLDRLDFNDFRWGLRHDLKDEGLTINLPYHGVSYEFDTVMEFGPRALGSTSCIANPTKEATEYINMLNGRPNIMPMAPMVHPSIASKYCKNIDKLGKCKAYMICATDWLGPVEDFRGVLHRKPLSNEYTCRAQVVSNDHTDARGVVINTSLNAHGQPILYTQTDLKIMMDIHETNSQIHRDSEGSQSTVKGLH